MWRTPSPQTALVYAKSARRLFTGGTDGIVRTWELSSVLDRVCLYAPMMCCTKFKCAQFEEYGVGMEAHTDWVTDLVEIPVRWSSVALCVYLIMSMSGFLGTAVVKHGP